MEIKRASFVTPPVTPRGSMHFGMNQLGGTSSGVQFDHADIQDFLRTLQISDDTLSIPEVEEPDARDDDDDDLTSEHSYTSSGSTTQEETSHDTSHDTAHDLNVNTNNNNSAGDITPTLSPVLVTSRATDNVVAIGNRSSHVLSNEVTLRKTDRVYRDTPLSDCRDTPTSDLSSPSDSLEVTAPTNEVTAPTNERVERKRFYNSLADLTTRRFAERRKSHKSTENLIDKRDKTDIKQRTRSSSTTSSIDSDKTKKAPPTRRKLFTLWRKSSQSTETQPTEEDHTPSGAVVYV